MSNICFNLVSLKTKDFLKITELLSKDDSVKYAQPYLDFNKILPVADGQNRTELWGTNSLPVDTHIHTGETPDSLTMIYFDTSSTPPIKAIEAIVRSHRIEMFVVGYEPSMGNADLVSFYFKDGFTPESSNMDDFLTITHSKDLDQACIEIFGYSHQEYLDNLNSGDLGDYITL